MSRRRTAQKRSITPDAKYKDKMVAKFANILMKGGKKSTAEGILYGAFDIIEERPARAAADGVPALAAQNDPRVAERRPGRVEAAPRLEGAPVRAPPVESRRVADDGPAPRQRRDGIFGERRVGVEQQERVAARRGHGIHKRAAAPAAR